MQSALAPRLCVKTALVNISASLSAVTNLLHLNPLLSTVVVRFWPSSRSWHVYGHLEAPLLCQRVSAHTSLTWAQEEILGPHPGSIRHHSTEAVQISRMPAINKRSFLISTEIISESLEPHPNPHPIRYHSIGVAQLSEMLAISTRLFPISTEILLRATQSFDTKTLQSLLLLHYLQLDNTSLVTHGSD